MKENLIYKLLFVVALISCINTTSAKPLLLINKYTLEEVKQQVVASDDKSAFALKHLIRHANKDLSLSPMSVRDSKPLDPNGNPLDYYSVGPYWWPNSETKDGLPWIRKDGEVNPVPRQDNADNIMFYQLSNAVHRLGLAYFFTEQEKYAEKLEQLLAHWFIDPETAMRPNLNFAQSVPGVAKGRPYGIIELRNLLKVLDSVTLVEKQLNTNTLKAFDDWLRAFYDWLKNSDVGKQAARKENNHGTFYDTLVVGIGIYLNKPKDVLSALVSTRKRIESQISTNGAQPHELRRTRPFHYSAFNLQAFTRLGVMAEMLNVDLWNYPSEQDQRIIRAFEFIADDKNVSEIWGNKSPRSKNVEILVSPAFRIGQRFSVDLKPIYQHESSHLQISMCGMLFGIAIKNADKNTQKKRYECRL